MSRKTEVGVSPKTFALSYIFLVRVLWLVPTPSGRSRTLGALLRAAVDGGLHRHKQKTHKNAGARARMYTHTHTHTPDL